VFTGRNAAGTDVVRIQLQKNGSTYQIRTGLLNDAGSWSDTNWYDISNTWTAIEIHYQAFAYSGSLILWLDDVQKQSLTFIDNDSRTLTDVRLGAQGIETGTRGTLYFDDFESRRFSYIGTLTDPGVDDPQATNQAGWFARTYQYSASIPHAVTSVNPETGSPDTYTYDANGNMTCRIENGVTFKQDYNAENRISAIHKMNGNCSTGSVTESWLYGYDGDGVRVTTAHYTGVTQDSLTLYYMGGMYEVTGSAVKKYYSIAGQTIAMNDGSGLKYLLTDHLGSTSGVVDQNGNLLGQQRYLPFGEVRTGLNPPYMTQTDLTYTGQQDLPGTGVMDYKARFYSPSLGRFLQADIIVSDATNPQDLNRFSYVNNRSTNLNDPSGHSPSVRQSVRPIVDPPKTTASCAKKSTGPATKIMDRFSVSDDDYLSTYTVASIGVQNPNGPRWWQPVGVFFKGKYASEGLAKVTDLQMETTRKTIIKVGDKEYGTGLGLRTPGATTPDQNDAATAILAMSTRIEIVLGACQGKCSPTDEFLGAALGGDSGFSWANMNNLRSGTYNDITPDNGIFPWEEYLEEAKNKSHNLKVIQQFVNNVSYLQEKGAPVPDVDWKYVCGLLK
jgi:RHS repeat-associated protein